MAAKALFFFFVGSVFRNQDGGHSSFFFLKHKLLKENKFKH